MKKIKWVFLILTGVTLSFITAGYLYTEDKVSNLGGNIGSYSFDMRLYSTPEIDYSTISLGTLLSFNMGIIGEEFVSFENNTMQNKWRDLIASDPNLAYSAFDLYSTTFVESYKASFEESKNILISYYTENPDENSEELIAKAESLNAADELQKSVDNMSNYNKLIDELLKLDDATLNRYMKSVAKDQCCFYSETVKPVEAVELRKWLGSKSFISQEEASYPTLPWTGTFPMDLILLSNRISTNYPKWTNRKFLQEAKKFSLHVQKNLKY
ncbi:MAG: hypothetical protein ACKO7D_00120 [Bacteroidota bacterium]